MTRLGEMLAPATRSALESMARELAPVERAPRHYAAALSRGGATRADMVSELHIRAAFTGTPLGGAVRYAWHRDADNAGTFYRCRVTRWGRYDVNSSRVVLAHTLRELWDALADRGLLARDVWCEDDAFLAFLLCGNVTPGERGTREHREPFTGTPRRERWESWHAPRFTASDGTSWELVRYADGTRRLAPRDPKRRDA